MADAKRDRISADLCKLRAALFEQARVHDMSPSDFVRRAVKQSLTMAENADGETRRACDGPAVSDRVRLSLRLSRATPAGCTPRRAPPIFCRGVDIAELVAGIPLLTQKDSRRDHLGAFVTSSAELATLSRNLHHLTTLLQRGEVRAARVHAEMLQTLGRDVRSHLALAAGVLADLQPSRGAASCTRSKVNRHGRTEHRWHPHPVGRPAVFIAATGSSGRRQRRG